MGGSTNSGPPEHRKTAQWLVRAAGPVQGSRLNPEEFPLLARGANHGDSQERREEDPERMGKEGVFLVKNSNGKHANPNSQVLDSFFPHLSLPFC